MDKLIITCVLFLLSSIVQAQDYCTPSPCGKNTDCFLENGRPICQCKPTYIGDPIKGCTHECEKNEDCQQDRGCLNFRCKDPCKNGCGDYATCEVRNHQAVCSCPPQYGGDAYTACIPECVSQAECPMHLACIDLHCGDPCIEKRPCKSGTNCKVERHVAVCTCKSGLVGHPLVTGCSRKK